MHLSCQTVKKRLISPAGGFQSDSSRRAVETGELLLEMFDTASVFRRKGRLRNDVVVCLVSGLRVHTCSDGSLSLQISWQMLQLFCFNHYKHLREATGRHKGDVWPLRRVVVSVSRFSRCFYAGVVHLNQTCLFSLLPATREHTLLLTHTPPHTHSCVTGCAPSHQKPAGCVLFGGFLHCCVRC